MEVKSTESLMEITLNPNEKVISIQEEKEFLHFELLTNYNFSKEIKLELNEGQEVVWKQGARKDSKLDRFEYSDIYISIETEISFNSNEPISRINYKANDLNDCDKVLFDSEQDLYVINPDYHLINYLKRNRIEDFYLVYNKWSTERKVGFWEEKLNWYGKMNSQTLDYDINLLSVLLNKSFKLEYEKHCNDLIQLLTKLSLAYQANLEIALKMIEEEKDSEIWKSLSKEL